MTTLAVHCECSTAKGHYTLEEAVDKFMALFGFLVMNREAL